MSDQALRSKVIRLAHQQPALRPHLLPLLVGGSRTAYDPMFRSKPRSSSRVKVKKVQVSSVRGGLFVKATVVMREADVPFAMDESRLSERLSDQYYDDLYRESLKKIDPELLGSGWGGPALPGEPGAPVWKTVTTKDGSVVFSVDFLIRLAATP